MSRTRRPLKRVLFILFALALVLGLALWWFSTPLPFDEDRAQQASAQEGYSLAEGQRAVVLEPADPSGQGLLFVPGARVPAEAYAWNLAPLAEAGVTVVIAKPRLGFAIAETRSPDTFIEGVSGVQNWAVGGHSLGGVKACAWVAEAPEAFGVLYLAGSYCNNDASGFTGGVLSARGSQDGLTEESDVQKAAHLLPASTAFVTLEGMNHAQFGSYGQQRGDLPATISDEQAREQTSALLLELLTP